MRALFTPAIAVMNRLPYLWKFALMGGLCLTVVVLLLASYFERGQRDIATAQSELAGLERISALHRVIQYSQQHRGLSSGLLNGDTSLADKRSAKEKQLDEAMAALAGLLNQTEAKFVEWQRIQSVWSGIKVEGLGWAPAQNIKTHSGMIRDMLDMMHRLGETTSLYLDPEPASYFMVQVALGALPETMEPMGQLRARGTGVLARQSVGELDRSQISVLRAAIERGMHASKLGLSSVLNQVPDLDKEVTPAHGDFRQAVDELMAKTQVFLDGDLSMAPAAYFDLATATIDKGYKLLYDTLLPTTRHLLEARLEQHRLWLNIYLLVSGLLLFGVAYATGGMYFSLAGGVKHFSAVAEQLAAGNLSHRAKVDSRDELGTMAASFNKVAESYASLVSHVQTGAGQLSQAAQEVKQASDRISDSAHDQSDAAASMAASVEQMTVGIDQISQNAQEANNASRVAGELSSQGSRLMGGLVGEIQEIAASVNQSAASIEELGHQSEKITAIVAVIKEIADQTNLLALNAAIEAARAGEAGRGFAVVADEVRKLAERTGASTQEIDAMVQAIQRGTQSAVTNMRQGVERVNGGVGQVREAGESMSRIQAGTEQVVNRVGEISAALREQAATAADIARDVENIARMAEQNSGQARGSTQASSTMLDLAGRLKAQVASYRV